MPTLTSRLLLQRIRVHKLYNCEVTLGFLFLVRDTKVYDIRILNKKRRETFTKGSTAIIRMFEFFLFGWD